ncbi:uncharacterized protein LOC128546831 [Mercenaria mercenaria]|uniref:uncharacterized protein LOC128546831 n=1 Tax=Mercenaria mercenaria TaxID=6596 RepID=UPI00234F028F|nr:uncharacterized protein LOC128546831 [Mercenaria mercenaria]
MHRSPSGMITKTTLVSPPTDKYESPVTVPHSSSTDTQTPVPSTPVSGGHPPPTSQTKKPPYGGVPTLLPPRISTDRPTLSPPTGSTQKPDVKSPSTITADGKTTTDHPMPNHITEIPVTETPCVPENCPLMISPTVKAGEVLRTTEAAVPSTKCSANQRSVPHLP